MSNTNNSSVIKAKSQLKDIQEDIKYSIGEDSTINVSDNDLKKIEFIKQTIDSLEKDYERLYDKIVLVINNRIKDIGKDQAKSDFIIQSLTAILKSEQNMANM